MKHEKIIINKSATEIFRFPISFGTKIKIILFVFTLMLFFASSAHASVVKLIPSKDTVDIGEQFYVDVMLDPQNVSINGIEGSVSFPEDSISFVRAENSKSLITLWVEEPTVKINNVSFAGLIQGGFKGAIDPFKQKQKLSGLMTRLIFEAKKSGTKTFYLSNPFSVTLNDGTGTALVSTNINTSINVGNLKNPFEYKSSGDSSPRLEATVTKSPDLFNGKYALIFEAKDSGTGIKNVMIKEGPRDWKKITSPYLLEDQGRHSLIALQATNYSGSSITVMIDPIPYTVYSPVNAMLLLVFVILIFIITKEIYAYKKRKQKK